MLSCIPIIFSFNDLDLIVFIKRDYRFLYIGFFKNFIENFLIVYYLLIQINKYNKDMQNCISLLSIGK